MKIIIDAFCVVHMNYDNYCVIIHIQYDIQLKTVDLLNVKFANFNIVSYCD